MAVIGNKDFFETIVTAHAEGAKDRSLSIIGLGLVAQVAVLPAFQNAVYASLADNLYVKDNDMHDVGGGGVCVTCGTNVINVTANRLKNCGTTSAGSAI